MNQNINSKNLDGMLKIVSKKLNMDPNTLRKQLEEGKFDSAIKNMNVNEAAKFKQLLNNPKLAEQILSSEQAQALYKKMAEGK